MGALAIVEAAPLPAGMQDWLTTGRTLLQQRTALDWSLGDWIADGRERFGDQAAFDFLADELGIAPKELKGAVKVATSFPPHLRDAGLSFAHHESVVGLPRDEALGILKRAKVEHLDDRETRIVAVKRRAEIQPGYQAEIDWTDTQYRDLVRRWNAASEEVRRMLIEQHEETGFADIEL